MLAGCTPTIAEITTTGDDGGAPPQDSGIPRSDNLPPVADAGDNMRVLVGTPVTVDPSNSYDPDGSAVDLAWELVEAPPGSRARVRVRADGTAAIDPDVVGGFHLRLTVMDEQGASGIDDVWVDGEDPFRERGIFAPGVVYQHGEIGGTCERGIGSLVHGERTLVGLDCTPEVGSLHVRMDGRAGYAADGRGFAMECDGDCRISRWEDYPPGDPLQNDEALELACPVPDEIIPGPSESIVRCGGVWHVGPHQWQADTAQPVALAHDGVTVLMRIDDQLAIRRADEGAPILTIPGIDWDRVWAWRAHEDGFRVASRDARSRLLLVQISADGSAETAARYADPGWSRRTLTDLALDAAGNLWAISTMNRAPEIVRYTPDGPYEVVIFGNNGDRRVLLDGGLVTGP